MTQGISVIVSRDAEQDLREASRYYRQIDPLLSRQFLEAFEQTMQNLIRFPLRYPTVWQNIHRISHLSKFPYSVYFLVEDNHIKILAVLHNSRHPDAMTGRILS